MEEAVAAGLSVGNEDLEFEAETRITSLENMCLILLGRCRRELTNYSLRQEVVLAAYFDGQAGIMTVCSHIRP